jgi:molybdopterin-guanine dinucleotide biosynthesis protein A
MPFSIPCVIFAGGRSSRMGEDKALLPFASHATLTEYQLHRLSKIFTSVYISCKDKKKFNFTQAQFIEDSDQNLYAPTAAFISVFETLKSQRVFIISVDAPFISEEIIQKLIQEDAKEYDATIAKSPHGMEPLCGIYHKSLLPKFLAMQKNNEHKLGQLLKNSKTNFVSFEDKEAFLNLNNPKEYQEARKLLKN